MCCFLFFVCVYLRLRISSHPKSIAGVLFDLVSTSVLPYCCAPLVCVSAVMELLAVWLHNKPKTKNQTKPKKERKKEREETTANQPTNHGLPYYCTPPVCIPAVLWRGSCVAAFKKKKHWSVWGPLREGCSIRSGASGLPYYCALFVCVSEVIKLLVVWWHNQPRTKNRGNRDDS